MKFKIYGIFFGLLWILVGDLEGAEVSLKVKGGVMEWSGGRIEVEVGTRYNPLEKELLIHRSDVGLTGKELARKIFFKANGSRGMEEKLEEELEEELEIEFLELDRKKKREGLELEEIFWYRFQVFEIEDIKMNPMRLEFLKKKEGGRQREKGEVEVIYTPYSIIQIGGKLREASREVSEEGLEEGLIEPDELFPMPWYLEVNWILVGTLGLVLLSLTVIGLEWRKSQRRKILSREIKEELAAMKKEMMRGYEDLKVRVQGVYERGEEVDLRGVYEEMERLIQRGIERETGLELRGKSHGEAMRLLEKSYEEGIVGKNFMEEFREFLKSIEGVKYGSKGRKEEDLMRDIKRGEEVIKRLPLDKK